VFYRIRSNVATFWEDFRAATALRLKAGHKNSQKRVEQAADPGFHHDQAELQERLQDADVVPTALERLVNARVTAECSSISAEFRMTLQTVDRFAIARSKSVETIPCRKDA
jgi:hypothetical protein